MPCDRQGAVDIAGVPSIREWPASLRPREKLLAGSHLSDAELLAILVGSGTRKRDAVKLAHDVLCAIGGTSGLARADLTRLRSSGLGPATAVRLAAALELGRRAAASSATSETVDSAESAARAFAPYLAHLERESMAVALLSQKRRLLDVRVVYSGTVSAAQVRIAELFTEAIRRNAPAILLAHNHPSGDPEPSPDDMRTTKDAISAGRLLGIDVLDHLVLGWNRFVSLRDRGLFS